MKMFAHHYYYYYLSFKVPVKEFYGALFFLHVQLC